MFKEWICKLFFKNKQQVVDDVIKHLQNDDKDRLRNMLEDDLCLLHFSLGMQIRNKYKLWWSQNPYVGGKHPDDFSIEIVKEVWKKLQQKDETV